MTAARLMLEDYVGRMSALTREASERGIAAVVIAPSPDMVYLMGYDPMQMERPTLLILGHGREPLLVVPELERPLVSDAPAAPALRIVGWRDGEDPYAITAASLTDAERVAIADRTWATHVLALQHEMPDTRFEPASPLIGRLRAVKSPDELAALRRAARGADEAFRQICTMKFQGRREEEVAADLADLLVQNGHARAEFTIVASGPNAASPHHEPTGRTILPRDAVVMDFGGELGGYYSDTTRTVVVGEAPQGFERVYETVRQAQEAACAAVRPGAACQDVDRAARRIIEDAGFGERFIHRTGHGIGLEVHEPPYIIDGNEWVLEPGTTFSVEPGIYLEGSFGVRIEDIVAVTDEGVERLNRSTRTLQVVE
ncbi:MAG TPA: Xaa-Pro peptidase family protein [Actinomycetota bacterium]